MSNEPDQNILTEDLSDLDHSSGDVTAWERFSFSTVRGFLWLHMKIWGMTGLYLSCRFFAFLEFLINCKRRRRIGKMIAQALNRKLTRSERNRLVKEQFMRVRCDKTFYIIFDMLSPEEIRKRFKIVNKQYLDDALARGKGICLLKCHHGSFHIAAQGLCFLGYPVSAVRAPNEGAIRRYIQGMWRRNHPDMPQAKMIFTGEFVRPLYRLLKANHILGAALDVSKIPDSHMKSVIVTVLGKEREFLTGTLSIAIRCKSAVHQVFLVSDRNFYYRLEVGPPLTDPDTCEETPEIVQTVMQKYADGIGQFATAHPDHLSRT